MPLGVLSGIVLSDGESPTHGKDLTEVRSPQRKLMPDTVGLAHHEPTSLRGIALRAQTCKDRRFRDL
jgi:RNA-directed DNA polymerase